MSERNERGKRERTRESALGRYWRQYKGWLAGMSRGQRIRYRCLQVATIISAVIVVAFLILNAWIKMPDLPDFGRDPSGGQGDLSFDGAEVPDIAKSGRKKGVYTFLVAGRDVASGSTDTILLLSYDTVNKTVHGLNIPRDTMINTSANSKRINSVYSRNRGSSDLPEAQRVASGMSALKKEIGKITGITPDFYVLVEWDAIGELVEALGGVHFEVPFDMDYDDPYQDLHIHQKAGYRKLSGEDAMQVIRWRKNNSGPSGGDIARLEVQQEFLKAVAAECLKPATFLKIPDLARIFTENVDTDLSVGNILAFAQMAYGMDPDTGVSFVTAPVGDSFRYDRAALITLDGAGILEIVNTGMNPYQRDIETRDLELIYRNKDGSFGVTNGELADPKMGRGSGSAGQSTGGKPSGGNSNAGSGQTAGDSSQSGQPQQPNDPTPLPDPDTSTPPQGGDTSQSGGDTSQEENGSQTDGNPSQSGSSSQGGDNHQGGDDSQNSSSGLQDGEGTQSDSTADGGIVTIDPDEVLPDPNQSVIQNRQKKEMQAAA